MMAVLIIAALAGIFIFGRYIMKKLDHFVWDSCFLKDDDNRNGRSRLLAETYILYAPDQKKGDGKAPEVSPELAVHRLDSSYADYIEPRPSEDGGNPPQDML